jgi:hypothetical protein
MRPRSSKAFAIALVSTAAWIGLAGSALSQTPAAAPVVHEIPQSLVLEHQDTMARLETLTHRHGAVGVEARKALDLFKRHTARELEYILPPLTLAPTLADGKVTPDMAWAMAMADRVKADHDAIYEEHTQITDAANALLAAGKRAQDKVAIEFAQEAVADSLNDMEIQEPTTILIGAYLHSKLDPQHP